MLRALIYLAIATLLHVVAGAPLHSQELRWYTATWCGPCQQIAPRVEALRQRGVTIHKIDCSQQSPPDVTGLPTFRLVDAGGNVVGQWEGSLPEAEILGRWSQMQNTLAQPSPTWGGQGGDNPPRSIGWSAGGTDPSIDSWIRAAICRVEVDNGNNETSWGSGCFIRLPDGRHCVQTCAHNLRGARGITVHFPSGSYPARVIDCSPELELASLQPVGRLTMAPLDVADYSPGERCRWFGYGGGFVLRTGEGTAEIERDPQLGLNRGVLVGTGCRVGDSGGPVVNQAGQVVGCVWGSEKERAAVQLMCDTGFRQFYNIERCNTRVRFPAQQSPPTTTTSSGNSSACRCDPRITALEEHVRQLSVVQATHIDTIAALNSELAECRDGLKATAELAVQVDKSVDQRVDVRVEQLVAAIPPATCEPVDLSAVYQRLDDLEKRPQCKDVCDCDELKAEVAALNQRIEQLQGDAATPRGQFYYQLEPRKPKGG